MGNGAGVSSAHQWSTMNFPVSKETISAAVFSIVSAMNSSSTPANSIPAEVDASTTESHYEPETVPPIEGIKALPVERSCVADDAPVMYAGIVTHHGAPFSCTSCGAGFDDRLTLAAHQRKHTARRYRRNQRSGTVPVVVKGEAVRDVTGVEHREECEGAEMISMGVSESTGVVNEAGVGYTSLLQKRLEEGREMVQTNVNEQSVEHLTPLTNVLPEVLDSPDLQTHTEPTGEPTPSPALPAQTQAALKQEAGVGRQVFPHPVVMAEPVRDRKVFEPPLIHETPMDDPLAIGGDCRDPAGDSRDLGGDSRDPGSDNRDPAGDNRDPAGDSRDPTGDSRDPAGYSRDPAGDSRDLGGDSRDLGGDSRDPGGDSRDPAGDSRDPGGDKRKQRRPQRLTSTVDHSTNDFSDNANGRYGGAVSSNGTAGRRGGRTGTRGAAKKAASGPLLFQCALCKERFAHVSELTEHVTSHLNNDDPLDDTYSNPETPMLDPASLLLASMEEAYLQPPPPQKRKRGRPRKNFALEKEPEQPVQSTNEEMDGDVGIYNSGGVARASLNEDEDEEESEESDNVAIPPLPPPDTSPITCEVCQVSCLGMEALVDHVYEHYKRRHIRCVKCGASFAFDWMMKHHMRLQHADGAGPASKIIPGLTFSSGKKGKKSKSDRPKYVPKRRYRRRGEDPSMSQNLQCDQCGFPARNWTELSSHCETSHPGVGRFPCDECEQVFRQKCLVPGHVCPGKPKKIEQPEDIMEDPLSLDHEQLLSEAMIKKEQTENKQKDNRDADGEESEPEPPQKKRGRKRKRVKESDDEGWSTEKQQVPPTRRSERKRKTRLQNLADTSDEEEGPKDNTKDHEYRVEGKGAGSDIGDVDVELDGDGYYDEHEVEDDMLQKPVKKRKTARRLCSSPESIPEPPVVPHPYECDICGRQLAHRQALMRHKNVHEKSEKRVVYQCDMCPSHYSRFDSLAAHAKSHSLDKVFQCPLCKKAFETRAVMNYHISEHRKRPAGKPRSDLRFSCVQCGKKLAHLTALRRHQRLHEGEQTFSCELCPKKYSRLDILMLHTKVHSIERPYRCAVCSRSFTQRRCLEYHSKVHGVDPTEKNLPFKCELCHRGFAEEIHLKAHSARHAANRSFLCDFCGKEFKTSAKLKRHSMIHTGERPFQCRVCGMRFIDKTAMGQHERIHSGERPFQCHICGKDFSRNVTLKIHSRSHTGDKPYPCEICSKAFSTMTQRTRHKRIHTGERPYVCGVCNRGFTQTTHLKVHMRTHMTPAQRSGGAEGGDASVTTHGQIGISDVNALVPSSSASATPSQRTPQPQTTINSPTVDHSSSQDRPSRITPTSAHTAPLSLLAPTPRPPVDPLALATMAAVEGTGTFIAQSPPQPTPSLRHQPVSRQRVEQPVLMQLAHPRFLLQHVPAQQSQQEAPLRLDQHSSPQQQQQPQQQTQRAVHLMKPASVSGHQQPILTIQQQHLLQLQQQQYDAAAVQQRGSGQHATMMQLHPQAVYQGDNSQHSQQAVEMEATDMTLHFLGQ